MHTRELYLFESKVITMHGRPTQLWPYDRLPFRHLVIVPTANAGLRFRREDFLAGLTAPSLVNPQPRVASQGVRVLASAFGTPAFPTAHHPGEASDDQSPPVAACSSALGEQDQAHVWVYV